MDIPMILGIALGVDLGHCLKTFGVTIGSIWVTFVTLGITFGVDVGHSPMTFGIALGVDVGHSPVTFGLTLAPASPRRRDQWAPCVHAAFQEVVWLTSAKIGSS